MRTQFQCEYRFFLDQRTTSRTRPEAIRGERLHQQITGLKKSEVQKSDRLVPLIIALLTITIGIVWILW